MSSCGITNTVANSSSLKSSSRLEVVLIAVIVTFSTNLVVYYREWIAVSIVGLLSVSTCILVGILVGILAERQALLKVVSEAYQACGAGGAPERLLDNLSAAINGRELPHKSILPVSPDEWNRL